MSKIPSWLEYNPFIYIDSGEIRFMSQAEMGFLKSRGWKPVYCGEMTVTDGAPWVQKRFGTKQEDNGKDRDAH